MNKTKCIRCVKFLTQLSIFQWNKKIPWYGFNFFSNFHHHMSHYIKKRSKIDYPPDETWKRRMSHRDERRIEFNYLSHIWFYFPLFIETIILSCLNKKKINDKGKANLQTIDRYARFILEKVSIGLFSTSHSYRYIVIICILFN